MTDKVWERWITIRRKMGSSKVDKRIPRKNTNERNVLNKWKDLNATGLFVCLGAKLCYLVRPWT